MLIAQLVKSYLSLTMVCLWTTLDILSQTTDSLVIRQVDSLINLSRDHTSNEEFERALELNLLAEKLALDKLGSETPSYANTCYNHGRILYVKGDYKDAEKWFLESLTIREKVLGKENLDYTKSLHNLALLYSAMQDYSKSLALNLESKDIRFRIIGKYHEFYAQTLHNIAGNYWDLNLFPQAQESYLEAISIRERVLGKEHSDYLYSIGNLANLYVIMNKFELAEPLFLESLTLHEKMFGKSSKRYGSLLNDLAIFYDEQLNFDKAEYYYKLSLQNIEKLQGKINGSYALALNNLGTLCLTTGRYEEAEKLFIEGIEIRKKISNNEHLEYLRMLSNLGALYVLMFNYDKAERLFLEVISTEEKIRGKSSSEYAISLGHLATIQFRRGNIDEAEKKFIEAKNIIEKVYSKTHTRYAKALTNLALIYMATGNYIQAEVLLTEAKNIFELLLGKQSFDYAKCLSLISNINFNNKEYSGALYLLRESKSIIEKTVGIQHPYFLEILNKELEICSFLNYYREVERILFEMFSLQSKLIKSAIHHLSDQELSAYIRHMASFQSTLLTFATKNADVTLNRMCFDFCILYKGLILNVCQQMRKYTRMDTSLIQVKQLYHSYKERIVREYSKPLKQRVSIEVIQSQLDSLEKAIVAKMAKSEPLLSEIKTKDVQNKLKEGEAVIEFVKYSFSGSNTNSVVKYAAFVLLRKVQSPILVSLFEQNQLNALLASGDVSDPYVCNKFYAEFGSEEHMTLYSLIWKPIEPFLKGIKRIYFSPDGDLHCINLTALRSHFQKPTIGEIFQMKLLGSSRQLVINVPKQVANNNIVLYGDIQYSLDTTFQEKNTDVNDSTFLFHGDKSGSFKFIERSSSISGARSLKNGEWLALKYSKDEINSIMSLMEASKYKVFSLSGSQATEESFKQLGVSSPSPSILHISTHGFFFPDPKGRIPDKLSGDELELGYRFADDPFFRSGMVLSGANYAWQTKLPYRDREDGILTAYEVSQMDLSHTELVVLSACETGLGDIKDYEGVYGLQRAFKIAGVQNIIMSLWKVDDEATSLFMTEFYRNLLIHKMPIRNALQHAQIYLRKQKRFSKPYYWAGWLLLE